MGYHSSGAQIIHSTEAKLSWKLINARASAGANHRACQRGKVMRVSLPKAAVIHPLRNELQSWHTINTRQGAPMNPTNNSILVILLGGKKGHPGQQEGRSLPRRRWKCIWQTNVQSRSEVEAVKADSVPSSPVYPLTSNSIQWPHL